MKISVFGAIGFIGSRFCELYPEMTIPIPRQETSGLSKDILYLISTTDNYNPAIVDVHVNISVLMDRLVNLHQSDTFNFVSSWFVYGDVPLPAHERIACAPEEGSYTITKLCAERLVADHCKKRNISYRIFRLANVFGKGDKFSEKKNALQYLINEMKHDRDIHLYNEGMFFRDYIHVDDVCRMLYEGMESLPVNQIYNVGSGRPILFRDMILLAHTVLGSKSVIHDSESYAPVQDFWMDTTKITSYGIINRSSPFEKLVRMIEDEL